jgi:hypothetical protein
VKAVKTKATASKVTIKKLEIQRRIRKKMKIFKGMGMLLLLK